MLGWGGRLNVMSVHLKHMSHLDTSDNSRVSSQQHRAQRTAHNVSPTHSLLAVEGKKGARARERQREAERERERERARENLWRIVRFQHPTVMNMARAFSRANKCHRETMTVEIFTGARVS